MRHFNLWVLACFIATALALGALPAVSETPDHTNHTTHADTELGATRLAPSNGELNDVFPVGIQTMKAQIVALADGCSDDDSTGNSHSESGSSDDDSSDDSSSDDSSSDDSSSDDSSSDDDSTDNSHSESGSSDDDSSDDSSSDDSSSDDSSSDDSSSDDSSSDDDSSDDEGVTGGGTVIISRGKDSAVIDQESQDPAVSKNGRYVTFSSAATVIVDGDTNGFSDVFVSDLKKEGTERVSVSTDGNQANGESTDASISNDGRFVSFRSDATNLVPGDTNGAADIFVRDRKKGRTERLSIATDGTESDFSSSRPRISANGRFVVFTSDADDLVAGDTNNARDVFVRDRKKGKTTRVSVASDGTEGVGGHSLSAEISKNGRWIAFSATFTNLTDSLDPTSMAHVYLHDRKKNKTRRISVRPDGQIPDGASRQPSISGNGRIISFTSSSADLVASDSNGVADVFIHNVKTKKTNLVSLNTDGLQANTASFGSSISGNGRFVAFETAASNLTDGLDTNGTGDIYLRDRKKNRTHWISNTWEGTAAVMPALSCAVSGDGHHVAFDSNDANIVQEETNDWTHVFMRHW